MFLCRSWFIGITQTPTVLDDCRGFCIGILTEDMKRMYLLGIQATST